MPFTPAHVVAAVPLAQRLGKRGVVSALAIGSMTPDLAYFLPLDVVRRESHSLAALIWFCLPVGLWVYGFFHLFVAPLFHDVTPIAVRERLPETWARGRIPHTELGAVALCVVLGAVTHLAWDSFTHYGTPLTRAVPMLAMPIGKLGGVVWRPVRVAQHVSTAFGLALLVVWGLRWMKRTPRAMHHAAPPPWLAALLVAAVAGPTLWLGMEAGIHDASFDTLLARRAMGFIHGFIYVGGSAFCASLTVVAVAWRWLRDASWASARGAPG